MFSKALFTYHNRQLRQSPATGVFLTCGWLAGVLLTFISGQLIATNRAELTALFTYLPWIMALLIPTLTMPVATESARGVTERLLTLPHTATSRIFSRFAVYWLLLGIWILGFWPLIVILYYLGSPDFGPIATGLLGSWLLAAPLLAVSLTICLRAKSGVGGLLGSLAACLLLLLVGTNSVTGWFAAVPGLGWLPAITNITLLGAYQTFTTGLLNASAILLLFGFTLFFLGMAVRPSRQPNILSRITNHELRITICGAVLILIALIPNLTWLQLDATAESLHTPSSTTLSTLRQLESPVTFTLYLSQNNPDVPPSIHQTALSLKNLLLSLRAGAPGKVSVKIANADASLQASIAALQAGAAEQSLPTGTTYFAALTATIASTTTVIPALSAARQPVQEYDVMSLVANARRTAPPTVAVLATSTAPTRWQTALQSSFTFTQTPAGVTEIPSTTSVLLLPDNAPLPTQTTQAIRTYLSHGGNVVLLADPFSRTATTAQPLPNEQRLTDLLPEFGLTYVSETVIADPTQGTLTAQDRAGAMSYPYWLQLTPKNFDQTLPFANGINKLFVPESGEITIDTATNPLTLTPVIATSPNARAVPLATFQRTPPELASAQLPPANGRHILAVMASGAFGESATASGNLLVMADADWLTDTALTQSTDNLTFLTGILHYFSGQSALTQLRAKGATPHTLTRIEDMANRLTLATSATEQKIATRLHEVTTQSAMNEDEIANAQEEEFTLRQQLRDIRQQTRHRLQMLENALLAINLALMPTVTGILFFLQRRRQRLKATSTL